MRMMMGQLQHAQGRRWKLRVNHETQNVKLVIFRHISSHDDYLPIPLPTSRLSASTQSAGPGLKPESALIVPARYGRTANQPTLLLKIARGNQLLPHLTTQHLAEHRTRQIVHRPRCGAAPYSESRFAVAVLAQGMLLHHRVPGGGNHGGHDHLAAAGLRDTDHRRIRHRIVLLEGGLHLGRARR